MSRDPEAIRELQQLGIMSTPVIVIDGQPVTGFNRGMIDRLLQQQKVA